MATKKKTKAKTGDAAEAKETKKKAKKASVKKDPTAEKAPKAKRKTKSKKVDVPDRMRLFWGVYNHSLKLISKFEFNQRKAAEKRAQELSEGGKPPHFVQKVKEVIAAEVPVEE
ncbi:MAG: hypothetical protein KF851_06940 [Pirellulaceae bacterium]|nr:hypothetical protein [Pirellulaceae bacterium]